MADIGKASSCDKAAHTVESLCASPRTLVLSVFTEFNFVQFLLTSTVARLLGLRVRNSTEAWLSLCCEVVCCQVEDSATDRSLVQGIPAECVCSRVPVSTDTVSAVSVIRGLPRPGKKFEKLNK
jgi:hypothetical protein